MKKDTNERMMSSRQKLVQMQYYWNNLAHTATDDMKKKSMKTRFGLKNIKLDRKGGKLIDFDEEVKIDEKYKAYPGKGWLDPEERPKINPKDIVWRSQVHRWDNEVRSDNTRMIVVDTKKSGKEKFQMYAVSDKSG